MEGPVRAEPGLGGGGVGRHRPGSQGVRRGGQPRLLVPQREESALGENQPQPRLAHALSRLLDRRRGEL